MVAQCYDEGLCCVRPSMNSGLPSMLLDAWLGRHQFLHRLAAVGHLPDVHMLKLRTWWRRSDNKSDEFSHL